MHIASDMLLVSGADRPLIERICTRLGGRRDGEQVQVVEEVSFAHAWDLRAHTLLCVESLPRAGVTPPEPASLASLVRAAEAPSVSRVIVVTSRRDTDGELRRLRRSGARYVIVRLPCLVEVEALRGKRVLVPRAHAEGPFVTADDLARAVEDAVCDRQLMGVTIDVPPSGLAALEAAGARPHVAAPWRVALGRWLKQPVLVPEPVKATPSAA